MSFKISKAEMSKGRSFAISIEEQSFSIIGQGTDTKSGSPTVEIQLERDGIKKVTAGSLANAIETANAKELGESTSDGGFEFHPNVEAMIQTDGEWNYKVDVLDEEEEEDEVPPKKGRGKKK